MAFNLKKFYKKIFNFSGSFFFLFTLFFKINYITLSFSSRNYLAIYPIFLTKIITSFPLHFPLNYSAFYINYYDPDYLDYKLYFIITGFLYFYHWISMHEFLGLYSETPLGRNTFFIKVIMTTFFLILILGFAINLLKLYLLFPISILRFTLNFLTLASVKFLPLLSLLSLDINYYHLENDLLFHYYPWLITQNTISHNCIINQLLTLINMFQYLLYNSYNNCMLIKLLTLFSTFQYLFYNNSILIYKDKAFTPKFLILHYLKELKKYPSYVFSS